MFKKYPFKESHIEQTVRLKQSMQFNIGQETHISILESKNV
jgi:hypothetical protein